MTPGSTAGLDLEEADREEARSPRWTLSRNRYSSSIDMAMASPSSGRCCLQRLLAVSAPSTSLLRALPACSSAPSDDAAYCLAHGAPATFRRGSRGSSHLEPGLLPHLSFWSLRGLYGVFLSFLLGRSEL